MFIVVCDKCSAKRGKCIFPLVQRIMSSQGSMARNERNVLAHGCDAQRSFRQTRRVMCLRCLCNDALFYIVSKGHGKKNAGVFAHGSDILYRLWQSWKGTQHGWWYIDAMLNVILDEPREVCRSFVWILMQCLASSPRDTTPTAAVAWTHSYSIYGHLQRAWGNATGTLVLRCNALRLLRRTWCVKGSFYWHPLATLMSSPTNMSRTWIVHWQIDV